MKYYLSYIETSIGEGRGHAALMLSCQNENDDKVKILSEIGLYVDFETTEPSRANKIRGVLWKIRGIVKEEQNASLAKYSNHKVQHRTYQISDSEVELYFQLINRDRRSNISLGEKVDESHERSKGVDYNLVRFNCKTYALEIFKELGIIDARTVRNPIIQVPNSTDKHMHVITSDSLRCDEKDNFLNEANNVLSEISELIKQFAERAYFPESGVDLVIAQLCKNIKNEIEVLEGELNKIGVSEVVNRDLDDMMRKMSDLNDYLSMSQKRIDNNDKWLIDKFKTAYQDMLQLKNSADEVSKKHQEGKLEYYWVTPPKSEKRLQVHTFSETEKAYYSVETKIKDMESCFSDLLRLIDKSKNGINDDLQLQDVESFEKMIIAAMGQLAECKEQFDSPIKQVRFSHAYDLNVGSNPILEKCSKANSSLNLIVENLNHKIASFQPKARDESGHLLSCIKQIINYLRKDYKVLAVDPKQVIKKKLDQQKKAFISEEKKRNKPKSK